MIDKLLFGKNLRPSTVEVMNKTNEIIEALNASDLSEIDDIKEQLQQLNISLNNLSEQIANLQSLEPRIQANETDLEKVKITLYTPLESTEKE